MKHNFVKYGTLPCLDVNLTKGKSTLKEAKLDLKDFENKI